MGKKRKRAKDGRGGEGGERGCHLDDGCRIESGIAVKFGVHRTRVQRLDQQALGLEIKSSQCKLIEVVGLADRGQADRRYRTFNDWSFTLLGEFLSVNRPEQQEYQTGGRKQVLLHV